MQTQSEGLRAHSHAVGSSEHPARLNEDTPTNVSEGLKRVLGPDLQGSLPRMGPWERLLPSKDPGRATGLRPPTLGELGIVWFRRVYLIDGWWCGWSWEEKG